MNAEKFNPKQKGLYFIPLGGSEQFGVNLNVYTCDGDVLAIDCGIGFADERHPGIDLLLPDPQFLEDHQDRLKGMIITHAHEDHIGAVAHLYNRLECPLYATKFTATVLRLKLDERGHKKVKINIIDDMAEFKIGHFICKAVPVAHSIPDSISVFLQTTYGNVLHSGDWNLDPDPVVGSQTNADHFKALGKQGVLAYIGDSTNSEYDKRAGSEGIVAHGLAEEMKQCNGKVAVTIFSSNIARIHSIAEASKDCGREVAVIGRSLHRMIGAAKTCGLLNDVNFIPEEDIGYLPDDKVTLIMTGSQGEYRAALARVSRGEHNVKLKPGDTVIFSARAIPGNEREISTVKNNLSCAGIHTITPKDSKHTIHVSGHPYQDEISQMYHWVKPMTVIPVHGEHTQLEAQAAFAKDCQVENTVIPQNGAVIQIAPGTPEIIDHVKTGLLAVDQKRIIKIDHQSIIARRKLQYSGTIHVSLVVDNKGNLLGDPKMDTVGLIDPSFEEELEFEDTIYNEILDILDDMSGKERLDDHFISEEIRIGLRRYVFHMLKIKPKTTVHVIRV
ncbi:MAG: MBL fold hydrolase [Micavibrio sp.]|nr:MBL fold hydrolase [Micavibrio sp.]|tara:strand:- start:6113 stop:7786 length:1674 start_codon:yes stop_codon:yes gene_type:complete